MTDFVVKDSGDRRTFSTGSVRDRGDLKPRPDMISPFALMRIGEHMRKVRTFELATGPAVLRDHRVDLPAPAAVAAGR